MVHVRCIELTLIMRRPPAISDLLSASTMWFNAGGGAGSTGHRFGTRKPTDVCRGAEDRTIPGRRRPICLGRYPLSVQRQLSPETGSGDSTGYSLTIAGDCRTDSSRRAVSELKVNLKERMFIRSRQVEGGYLAGRRHCTGTTENSSAYRTGCSFGYDDTYKYAVVGACNGAAKGSVQSRRTVIAGIRGVARAHSDKTDECCGGHNGPASYYRAASCQLPTSSGLLMLVARCGSRNVTLDNTNSPTRRP